jgi:hypothetical protein
MHKFQLCSLSRLRNYLFAVLIDNGQGSPSRCVNYLGYVVLLLKWIPDIDPPIDPSKGKDYLESVHLILLLYRLWSSLSGTQLPQNNLAVGLVERYPSRALPMIRR